jgi:aryl-alcohol dehydrogenase-like predicted oxidoreductase
MASTQLPRPEMATIGGTLKVSRMVTGLWQLAGGHDTNLQLDECAKQMQPLIDAGLTTFDMADRMFPKKPCGITEKLYR